MEMGSLVEFGLGGALIGAFFIPFIYKLYNDLQKERDNRINDMKEVINTFTPLISDFNSTASTLINVVRTNNGRKVQ